MCGRFVINSNKDELVEIFDIDHVQLPVFEPNSNIPPGTNIPIIYNTGNEKQLSDAYWGLIPSWSKDKSFSRNTFNARSETLAEKPSFKNAYKTRRCLIPASAYYEWAKIRLNGSDAGKQPFWIGRKDKDLFAFAGLYEHWTDTNTGESIQNCTVITREAYSSISHIHARMPVILPRNAYQDWLNATLDSFPMIDESELHFHPINNVGTTRQQQLF